MMPSAPLDKILPYTSREELRQWLQEHGTTQSCCWVPVSLKPRTGTLLYLDAVEEALCFGWIDGVKKKTSDGLLLQRLSPRNRKSSWTELNKERVRRLEKLGLMEDAGRKVLPDMNPEAFVVDADFCLNNTRRSASARRSPCCLVSNDHRGRYLAVFHLTEILTITRNLILRLLAISQAELA